MEKGKYHLDSRELKYFLNERNRCFKSAVQYKKKELDTLQGYYEGKYGAFTHILNFILINAEKEPLEIESI